VSSERAMVFFLAPRWRFSLLGVLLSFGALAGWLLLQWTQGTTPAEEIAAAPLLSAYLLVSTAAVFMAIGWFLGIQFERLEEANRRLQELASRDALTGLWNVRTFWRDLRREMKRADRDDGRLHLAIVDLDHFKQINDNYGHPEGDRVLKAVADAMKEVTREEEGLYRVGGEEFAVVLLADEEEAFTAAERIRKVVEELTIGLTHPDGLHPLQITISIGLAAMEPEMEPEVLYRQADRALYQAKRGGRNRVSRPPVTEGPGLHASSEAEPVTAP
jgi:diguanylate cyclase (GGDEF)-like protein